MFQLEFFLLDGTAEGNFQYEISGFLLGRIKQISNQYVFTFEFACFKIQKKKKKCLKTFV